MSHSNKNYLIVLLLGISLMLLATAIYQNSVIESFTSYLTTDIKSLKDEKPSLEKNQPHKVQEKEKPTVSALLLSPLFIEKNSDPVPAYFKAKNGCIYLTKVSSVTSTSLRIEPQRKVCNSIETKVNHKPIMVRFNPSLDDADNLKIEIII